MLGGIPPPPANGNWHRYLDQESGREYFHNAVTGQTTWERPAEMPAFPPVVVVVATRAGLAGAHRPLSLIHISEPTRLLSISYAVFCLKKKKKNHHLLLI
eukprot:TRINITY_DN4094_c0_g1_i2.p2 TRINITY_DN4094_c0_g1~~TRINITY_DN4094_c0_g1_i2.p2  ORF type:complete len:100 (-),score=15.12 TRINITY_DN4094_c0_g1_i2:47-346(-)